MMSYSTVLVQNNWGVHLNFDRQFSYPPSCPAWLTQLQQYDWQQRGIVVWNADLGIVAHFYAGYALELLEHLQGNDAWKTNGLVIGSPAFQLSTSSMGNPSPKIGGAWILESQMELSPDQVQDLVEFLTAQKSLLKRISTYDKEDAKEALSKVYQLIAAYGRQVREGKKSDKLIETTKPNIGPIFIPRGNYFTVHQAAQICHATSKQIRAWIRKGELEAFDLPGLGLIIETEGLNEFLSQRNI
ncbi:MAG: helix-turn-helix domain-containing protein [Anaerolineales bacterium]|nr:helix-turn-helix domain-containing protein [Anaerolineales bacterium]